VAVSSLLGWARPLQSPKMCCNALSSCSRKQSVSNEHITRRFDYSTERGNPFLEVAVVLSEFPKESVEESYSRMKELENTLCEESDAATSVKVLRTEERVGIEKLKLFHTKRKG